MRHKAFIPVEVPPSQPAGLFTDPPSTANMRFAHTTETILAGARVRIWGGYELDPSWLPDQGARSGVLGTVVRYLPIPRSLAKEAVVHLDRPLLFDGVIGDFVVLRLRDSLAHWTSGEGVSVELCEFEPNMRFIRRRDRGVVIEVAAICELL